MYVDEIDGSITELQFGYLIAIDQVFVVVIFDGLQGEVGCNEQAAAFRVMDDVIESYGVQRFQVWLAFCRCGDEFLQAEYIGLEGLQVLLKLCWRYRFVVVWVGLQSADILADDFESFVGGCSGGGQAVQSIDRGATGNQYSKGEEGLGFLAEQPEQGKQQVSQEQQGHTKSDDGQWPKVPGIDLWGYEGQQAECGDQEVQSKKPAQVLIFCWH